MGSWHPRSARPVAYCVAVALGGTIRGKKATLRMPTEADLEGYARWAADMRVRRAHHVWHEPAMPATWKERLKEAAKEERTILWSIETDGRLIGMAAGRIGWMKDFDLHQLVIEPEEWRKGFGFDAALALHRYFFDYLDLDRTAADLRADNAAALRIAERLGYVAYARAHEAHYRDGAYVDGVQLVMRKETWRERWSGEREYPKLAADAFR
jgi:RimJ/RimL family protein N-acetyltransferase